MIKRLHNDESGVAIIIAVLALLVAMGIIVAISVSAMSTLESSKNRKERVIGRQPVDVGVQTYVTALDAWDVGEHTGFRFTQQAMTPYLIAGQAIVPNGSLPEPLNRVDHGPVGLGGIPADARFTIQTNVGDDAFQYWQMYSLVTPQYNDPSSVDHAGRIIAYFRGWAGDAAGTVSTAPELVRVELRPGRFSDYQVLSDGPMAFGAGATINGKLHSNGMTGAVRGWNWSAGDPYIQNIGAVSCSDFAELSTRAGSINLACGLPASKILPDTGDNIGMLRAETAMDRYWTMAPRTDAGATAHVRKIEFNGLRDAVNPANGVAYNDFEYYNVTLSGSSIAVEGASKVSYNVGDGLVLVIPGHIMVRGQFGSATARATIAAYDPDVQFSASTPPSIWITGSTGKPGGKGSAAPLSSVGFVAQGDIIPYHDSRVSPWQPTAACGGQVLVRAAMIAAGGGIALAPTYRTPTLTAAATPLECPGPLDLDGSISGHFAPGVKASFVPNGGAPIPAGFAARSYNWDPELYNNPPPLFPLSGPHQVFAYSDANFDCFSKANGQLIATTPPGDCS